jgi:hypothetical protein
LIERQAAAAEQKKVPLDPGVIQQAYQTRERIETLSTEAQEIYQRLQKINSTQQRGHIALQQDVTRVVATQATVNPAEAAVQPDRSSSSSTQPQS